MERDSKQSKELMKKIIESQQKSNRQCITYSKQLLSLSVAACDLYGTAFAYRYLSFSYFIENKIKLSFQIGKKALSLSETNNFKDLLPDLYNLLGYIYHIQSLEQLSIEYFLKGLKAAKAAGNIKTICYIYSNIANLYSDLKQYKKCIYYINKAYQILKRESEKTKTKIPALSSVIHNMIDSYLRSKNFSQAEKMLNEAESMGVMTEPVDICSCYNFHARIEWNKGNKESFLKYYRKGVLLFDSLRIELISFMEALDFIELSLETGQTNDCKKLFDYALKGAQLTDLPVFWLDYYKLLIQYCRVTGEKELELSAKKNWRIWKKKKEANEQLQKNLGFEMQEKIKAVQDSYNESKNMHNVLRQASNSDYLTSINNRRRYLEDIKLSLRQLQKKQEILGLIYIDIDFFKEYNDCFGHVQGDSCLRLVAQTIKECFQDLGNTYRIGGDEFAVILKNKSKNEIKERMKLLKDRVYNLKIHHPLSEVKPYLTVSIGAYMAVPNMDITITDFCKTADYALYHVKKNERNGFYIVEGKQLESTR